MRWISVFNMCLVATLSLFACEKRKSGLLPQRNAKAATTAASIEELRARAIVGEGLNSAELDQQNLSEDEIQDLQKVKEDAIERIRSKSENLPRNLGKAGKLFQRAHSLIGAGQISEAQDYYLAACQMGHAEGCHKFGWYEERSGNRLNAGQFYKTACAGGLSKSCNNLAVQLEHNKRWDDALDYYARACLEHHAVSCENLKRLRNERLRAKVR